MRTLSIWLVMIASVFFACNNAGNQPTGNTAPKVENHEAHDANHEAEPASKLELNNGVKWQADETTRHHVEQLQAQFSSFAKQDNQTVNSYQVLATNLQVELDKLVKECKMSGPDHDALHVWLQAVLKDVVALEKIQSVEDGKEGAAKTFADINKFNQYFN